MKFPTLIVLSGVPRSGKTLLSQFLSENHGFIHVSADALRKEYGMSFGQADDRERYVNHVVHYRALEALMMKKDVVIDSTAMFAQQRQLFFDLAVYAQRQLLPIDANRVLVSLDVDPAVWEERQKAAGRDISHREFFFGKFEPVSPREQSVLDAHLRFDSNTVEDMERIKSELSGLLQTRF